MISAVIEHLQDRLCEYLPFNSHWRGGQMEVRLCQKVEAFLPDLISWISITWRKWPDTTPKKSKQLIQYHHSHSHSLRYPRVSGGCSQIGADRFLAKNSLNYMELKELSNPIRKSRNPEPTWSFPYRHTALFIDKSSTPLELYGNAAS